MKLTAQELKIKNEMLDEKELDNVNGTCVLLNIPLFKEVGRWFVNKFNLKKTVPQQVTIQQ